MMLVAWLSSSVLVWST